MESIFHIQPFSEKIENYEIHIFVPNSQNLEFIKSLTWNIESLMIWQTKQQEWFIYMQIWNYSWISSAPTINIFENGRKKSGEISYWKKQILSEYVPKVVKHLFTNPLWTTVMEKWLILHKN